MAVPAASSAARGLDVRAPDGHAALALADGRLRLETISYGLLPRG